MIKRRALKMKKAAIKTPNLVLIRMMITFSKMHFISQTIKVGITKVKDTVNPFSALIR